MDIELGVGAATVGDWQRNRTGIEKWATHRLAALMIIPIGNHSNKLSYHHYNLKFGKHCII